MDKKIESYRKFDEDGNIRIPEDAETISVDNMRIIPTEDAKDKDSDEITKIIYIPASVTNIDFRAFAPYMALQSFIVDLKNPQYKSFDGMLFSKNGKTLYLAPQAKENVVIPDGTEIIGESAFENSLVKDVVIADSVTTIRTNAFNSCSNLKNVTIPKNVNFLGEDTFAGCIQLENVMMSSHLYNKYPKEKDKRFPHMTNVMIMPENEEKTEKSSSFLNSDGFIMQGKEAGYWKAEANKYQRAYAKVKLLLGIAQEKILGLTQELKIVQKALKKANARISQLEEYALLSHQKDSLTYPKANDGKKNPSSDDRLL